MTWQPRGPAWLFCPADRPERFAKAAAAADIVILDLEDGVAPAQKPEARQALIDTPLDPELTIVRINPHGTEDFSPDLEALAATSYSRIMLPKCESGELPEALDGIDVVALIETPLGAMRLPEIVANDSVVGVMWGAEDLIAGLGGTSSRTPSNVYRDVARHVRGSVLLAAKSTGTLAIDSVYLDIKDLVGLAEECDDAVASGFDVKVAIHPSQVPTIAKGFAPTPDSVTWAHRVLDAASGERGVFAFEGRMVDAPVIRHAEQILRRHTAAAASTLAPSTPNSSH
ncbi:MULTISPECIES: CoA ester lyase [unclassified Gordonia (in: high G+C Gram-positive bacteria)]|uniref:HpcH/HpaI aldolase/citrate lyase family protein n=1 Tax=unclassified Gordonia (in: high G+C Gram-positive bacteria) TaxID=2657482 RepID=UPI0009ABF0ED|nr:MULTISPECIES: CoA ester lyase [unclassified Gordonia (in: high G+C Gram-positive bacteria)]MDF3281123.1 CoA ester lyase [Gordonia sp. N1V]OPX14978.1 CoA ester lyase [Gordonia sp. i37]